MCRFTAIQHGRIFHSVVSSSLIPTLNQLQHGSLPVSRWERESDDLLCFHFLCGNVCRTSICRESCVRDVMSAVIVYR